VVKYSAAVQCSAVQCSAAQRSALYCYAQCSTVQNNKVQYNIVQRSVVQNNIVLYSAVESAIQVRSVLSSTNVCLISMIIQSVKQNEVRIRHSETERE
jgi:hypothetical protein